MESKSECPIQRYIRRYFRKVWGAFWMMMIAMFFIGAILSFFVLVGGGIALVEWEMKMVFGVDTSIPNIHKISGWWVALNFVFLMLHFVLLFPIVQTIGNTWGFQRACYVICEWVVDQAKMMD